MLSNTNNVYAECDIADLILRYQEQTLNPVSIQCHEAFTQGVTHTNNTGPWAETHTETYSS